MSGKPCTHCGVGWMKIIRVMEFGKWYRIWYCATCNFAEMCGIGEMAHG